MITLQEPNILHIAKLAAVKPIFAMGFINLGEENQSFMLAGTVAEDTLGCNINSFFHSIFKSHFHHSLMVI